MQKFLHYFALSISLFTACGVFIHDGRIDRATSSTLRPASPVQSASNRISKFQHIDAGVNTDPHTHPEKVGKSLLKGFSYQNPSVPPREQKSKKYMLQNQAPRGRHAFDNYHLPVVA